MRVSKSETFVSILATRGRVFTVVVGSQPDPPNP
ncbi:MAG: hypothetical protein Ct9H300mP1_13250 [Planctomycetaceae bacterium]|nr:MAG: hypothetical protein Ct9H300mP1_13250 [Planctomycetaceae bacterium]